MGRHISLIIPADRTRRRGPDHRHPESRAADRTLRNRAAAERRPARPGFADHLARQGRGGPGHRGVQDRTGHHRQRQAEERERRLLRKRRRRTPSSGPSSTRGRCSPGSWPWTARSSKRTDCPGGVRVHEGTRSSASRWGSSARPRTVRADLTDRDSAGRPAAAGESFRWRVPYFVADGSERVVDVILPAHQGRGGPGLCSWPRPGPTSPTASGPRPTGRSSSRWSRISTDFIGMCDLGRRPVLCQPGRVGDGRAGRDRAGPPHPRPGLLLPGRPGPDHGRVLPVRAGEGPRRDRRSGSGTSRPGRPGGWPTRCDPDRRRRAAGRFGDGQPGRHRAAAAGGRPAAAGGGPVRGRPPQGRVPGDAGPRAAQPARPDPQRPADPRGCRPRPGGRASRPAR